MPMRALLVGLVLLSTGCVVRAYQPMGALYQPIVVDPTAQNLTDVRITVRCLPIDLVNRQQATRLCQRVGTVFENQGAVVFATIDRAGAIETDGLGGQVAKDVERPTDLEVQLHSRRIHKSRHPFSIALSIATLTMVPAIYEETYALDITVRDATGFLLAQATHQGRLLVYRGVGTWAGNHFLDRVTREKEDRIMTKGAMEKDLSDDLYGRVSQVVFNAKMQWRVLGEAAVDTAPTP